MSPRSKSAAKRAASAPEAEPEGEGGGARAFWSGTLTFGLVSVPVELFPAVRSRRASLRMLGKEGTPLTRRYFNPETGEELSGDDIVRGYPLGKDRYVPVTDDELERVAPEKTRDIDLVRFVPLEQLDPAWFQRAYYLAPGGNTTKAYRLLAATMEKTGKAGIATFVMRGVEYLVAIVAESGILRAETLRFPDELRSPEDVGLPKPGKPPAKEVKRIAAAIGRLSKGKLDERELEDVWSQGLSQLAEKKRKKGTDVVEAPEGEARVDEDARVIDLLEVLKRSMQAAGPAGTGSAGKAAKKTTRKAARKTTGHIAKKSAKKSAKKTTRKSSRKSRAQEAG